jgi:hypothetical protein
MSNNPWLDGFQLAQQAAEAHGLSHWIYEGLLYVQDGGKRGSLGADGYMVDAEIWQHGVRDTSARSSTTEERAMWTALTGLE